jgi:hypothetical protein
MFSAIAKKDARSPHAQGWFFRHPRLSHSADTRISGDRSDFNH